MRHYLAGNIYALRKRRDLSQEQLAERAGISTKHLQRLEHATTSATLDVIGRIADALGVPPGSLLTPADVQPKLRGRPRKK